jgi:hypothetical protein
MAWIIVALQRGFLLYRVQLRMGSKLYILDFSALGGGKTSNRLRKYSIFRFNEQQMSVISLLKFTIYF